MKQFLTALHIGIALCATTITGAGHAADTHLDAGNMTGAYYMRDTLVPRTDDLALMQRKPALYLASFNDDMATVAYSLVNGRIVYQVVQGEVGDGARADIDRALVLLQRKLN